MELTSNLAPSNDGSMVATPAGDALLKSASLGRSLFGAIQKVTSKLKAELDDSGAAADDEQQQQAAYEAQWLAEFEKLRTEFQVKWDTCTHSADEFCGLLLHSSDVQQQAYLLHEYPTLMEAWRDADLRTLAPRLRPDWPAAVIASNAAVDYESYSDPTAETTTQRVETSRSLLEALETTLRVDCQWSEHALKAFTLRLEQEHIFSCAELLACLAVRRGAYVERAFQSRAYPRLSKTMLRALQRRARELEQRDESVRELSMEPLCVNPQ